MDRNRHIPQCLAVGRPSLSARRAWIEISTMAFAALQSPVALRKESVDRNQDPPGLRVKMHPSLSARRAWIEIFCVQNASATSRVALRKESVDRNLRCLCLHRQPLQVALRKESVDRNKNVSSGMPKCQVALRKESVDRNQQFRANFQGDPSRSPQGERG